ncbi:MAG: hypothetical protein RXQ68_01020 [Candidatus Nanopusillus sp.]
MALDDVVKNVFAQLSTDTSLGQQVYNAIISSLNDTLLATAKQIEMQLDPKVNKGLKYTIEGFNINSTKDNMNPSQLYSDLVNIYKQNIFGNSTNDADRVFSSMALLSTLYIRGLKKLGNPDPITGRREYATRQERENAQNIVSIIAELLPKLGAQYYQSIGKNVSEQEIMANLDEFASALYGSYSGVINSTGSYILSKTPNISLLKSSTRLMSTLNDTFLSTIESSIYSIYSKVQIPEAVALILGKLGQIGFYNNTFDEMYRKIGSYIGQGLKQQQNQPVVPQQIQNQPLQPKVSGLSSPLQKNNLNTPQPKVIKSP